MKPNTTITRLLIAEDDPWVRMNIVSVATSAGFCVVGETDSGPDAVKKTFDLAPDVILMDIEMPGFSGIDAARRIQSTRPTPIVILTGHDSPELLRAGTEAGVGAYLIKPPRIKDLVCAISIASARHADLLQLRQLLAQKEILIREVYHRVANQMGLAATLLHLQAARVHHSPARDILLESEGRIRTLARIHNQLQDIANLTRVPLGLYLSTLASDLVAGLRPDVTFTPDIPNRHELVPSTIALQCGLLVHELVMNCLRHAFLPGHSARIHLTLVPAPSNRICLIIRDNGKGLPPGFSVERPSSLGLMIASALARDLNGHLTARSARPGTEFSVEFPVPPSEEETT